MAADFSAGQNLLRRPLMTTTTARQHLNRKWLPPSVNKTPTTASKLL
jgi:hypothetical protein